MPPERPPSPLDLFAQLFGTGMHKAGMEGSCDCVKTEAEVQVKRESSETRVKQEAATGESSLSSNNGGRKRRRK